MHRLLTPPVLRDAEQTRKGRLLFWVLWGIITMVTFVEALECFVLPGNLWRWLFVMLVMDAVCFGFLALNRRGHTRLASQLLLWVSAAVVMGMAWTAGGIRAPVMHLFPLVALFAGLLLNWRSGMLAGLLCVLGGLGLVLAEYAGFLPANSVRQTSLSLWLALVFFVGMLLLLQYLAVESIDAALQAARDELAQRRQTEAALVNSEALRKRVFDSSRVPIVVMDGVTFRFIDCNPAAAQIYGLSSCEQVLGKTTMDVSAPVQSDGAATPEKARFYIERALAEGTVEFEWRHQRPGGELWESEVHLMSFRSGERQLLQFTLQDITQRKRAEAALSESEGRFRELFERSPEAVFVEDDCGEILDANPEACRLHGLSREHLVGKNMMDLVPQASKETFSRHFPQWLSGEMTRCEGIVLSADGRETPVEVKGARIRYGKRTAVLLHAHDISERKQAEEARQTLQEQLIQAQKMEAVGQLAGGVAHDFNNILAAIMMNLGLLQANRQLDGAVAQPLKELMAEAERAAGLTRQLLLFSRRSRLEVKALDLNEVVANLLKMLGRLISEDIDLQFQRKTGLPAVEADAGMLEQVLMNLCVNARDAMPKGGRISISTDAVKMNGENTSEHPQRRPGAFVCLSVTDTGCGMDELTLHRIFEPFFTTKAPGKGTGLGLATVHGIVAQHHGWVEVQSQPGRGTTFRVFLPASAKSVEAVAENRSLEAAKGHETILLAEDDPGVRRIVVQTLRVFGYRVLEAADGREALKLWQKHGDEVNLLFSDMVMSEGLTGLDLAEKLQAEKPGLKVIISSGYSATLPQSAQARARGIFYLPKPYQVSVLGRKVRECLDR